MWNTEFRDFQVIRRFDAWVPRDMLELLVSPCASDATHKRGAEIIWEVHAFLAAAAQAMTEMIALSASHY